MPTEVTDRASISGLPNGWLTRTPERSDVDRLVELVTQHQAAVLGSASVDAEAVEVEAVGMGSWTRRQVVVVDGTGGIRAWARVHDRAAGRTVVTIDVHPGCADEELGLTPQNIARYTVEAMVREESSGQPETPQDAEPFSSASEAERG